MEVISRVLRKHLVESVPLLTWRLPVQGQAGLLNCGLDLRTDCNRNPHFRIEQGGKKNCILANKMWVTDFEGAG
jgi:hypothetical protein